MLYYIANQNNGMVRFLLGMPESGVYEFTNRLDVAWPFPTQQKAFNRVESIEKVCPGLKLQIVTRKEAKNLTRLEPKR